MSKTREAKGHTPGPWSTSDDPLRPCDIMSPGNRIIATVSESDMVEAGDGDANARLIAAAPALLAALELMIEDFGADFQGPTIDAARAAIAQARAEGDQ